MAFNTVAEADTALGYLDDWTALAVDAKERELDTAELWLMSGYALPAVPSVDELAAIKRAELTAVRYGLTTPLFPAPGAVAGGGTLTKRRRKVDVLEIEEQWSAPENPTAVGRLSIAEVDAILGAAGITALDATPRALAFVV